MVEIINSMNAQMANLPNPVQMWMNWMMLMFLCSILFVWKYKTARWVLASFLLSMPLAMFVYYLTNTVHLLGIVHIIIWLPLLIFIYRVDLKSESFKKMSPYGIWTLLLASTIVISLAFDVRDIYLVSIGNK
jgi:CDP-diglyceride synthetase